MAVADNRSHEQVEAVTASLGASVGPSRSRRGRAVWLGILLTLALLLLTLVMSQVSRAASWWVPPQNSTWDWQLAVPVDQTVDAQVYDIDLFENEASVVSSLHAQGRHVICYLDTGTWEGWRPDASKFPASVLGKADPGWTEERWLDIRQLSILEPIMEARFKLCKEKGFDAIEADNVDVFQNESGFPITAADQLTYNKWLAGAAHALGLSIAMKSDTNQIAELEPYFDFQVDEECIEYAECNLLEPFIKAGKAVFEVEYAMTPSQFCSQLNALKFMAMQKNKELDAWSAPCWAQGNWVGAKGAAGYDLAGFNGSSDLTNMPEIAVTLVKGSRLTWASPTTDTRALQGPDGSTRNATAYSDPNEVQVQLHFSHAFQGNLHLYAVDWDSTARRETITAGGQTANLTAGNFGQGAWVSFPINVAAGGTVPITVKRTAGTSAVLSGIFLGDAGPSSPAVTTAPQGTWVSAYGSQGYDLADWNGVGDLGYTPSATTTLVQGSRYQWASQTTDVRALQSPDGLTRAAATYYDPNQIQLKLSFPGAYSGNLHLYALDWDSTARRETITVNGSSATLGEFKAGAWVTFPISVVAGGTVTITVDHTAGANAVLSGIFLGDAGTPPAIGASSSPQGSWVGTYGSGGYDLLGFGGSSDLTSLSNASVSVEQASRYTWASSSADARALQSPDKSTRLAATLYDPNQIKLHLSFTAPYSGNLELYALDWDSTARREMISVNGQTAVLADDFSKGAWITFPISVGAGDTVTITVDRLAGSNAVLSGVFLG